MDIIVRDPGRYHVSLDTVWEFEEAIYQDPRVRLVSSQDSILSHVPNVAWRLLYRVLSPLHKNATGRRFDPAKMPDTFAVMMGRNFRKVMPRLLVPGRKGVYFFDAWPQNQEKICRFADACQIDHLFISSSQATEALGRVVRATACHWIPEGITPGDYYLAFTPEKDIDVLQLGRRYNTYHEAIAAPLEKSGKVYLYEKAVGSVVFPTRLDYVEGLARTKISICVPSSITHPARAGGIETMTVRYLQSMLSRCLIVGHAPAEMIELFGYNPLIEIDENDPPGQLLRILDRLPEYQPLIEKNYQLVREQHTWDSRWQRIVRIINGEQADIPKSNAAAGTAQIPIKNPAVNSGGQG
jgi:hypothetical protein